METENINSLLTEAELFCIARHLRELEIARSIWTLQRLIKKDRLSTQEGEKHWQKIIHAFTEKSSSFFPTFGFYHSCCCRCRYEDRCYVHKKTADNKSAVNYTIIENILEKLQHGTGVELLKSPLDYSEA